MTHSSLDGALVDGLGLLGVQAAVAVAMVAVAALLTASAQRMLAGMHFEASHVALMRLRPRLMKYPPERAQRFQREVDSRLAALPGVESVSMVGIGAVLGGGAAPVALPGWTADQQLRSRYNEIAPRYFATLRTPLLHGREFDARDVVTSAPVAIVNETLARRLWPGGGVVGATILIRNRPHQVVGVASDVLLNRRTEETEPYVYTPFWQNPQQVDSRLCIRVAGDPAAMLTNLVREVNRIDPDVPIAETITLPIQMAGWIRPLRVSAAFIGYAAGLAMLLTAIGLYGSLSFTVSRRTKEIGIRMALGAARVAVFRLFVREGMSVVVCGALAGIVLLLPASVGDPSALCLDGRTGSSLCRAALISLVGLSASLLPARRAAAVEPLAALRHE